MQINAQLWGFIRKNWLLFSVMGTAVVAGLWITGHLVLQFVYFNHPGHQDEDLKGWMTPRYIVLSYDLPRPFVLEALSIPEPGDGRRTLRNIAEDKGLTLEQLTEIVRTAAQEYRAAGQ